jgi:hypothetical protein
MLLMTTGHVMLNALPMSIFGPLSLLYWLYYIFLDPIMRLLGLSGTTVKMAVKHTPNGTVNGSADGKINGHSNGYARLSEKA